ncbi:MAG: hypothetical protein PQJ46_17520 [Spirochaetales bacterium]|nr:hypothetical protein [Spirochaetales bacterium]
MFKTVEYTIWDEKVDFHSAIRNIEHQIRKEFKLIRALDGHRKWDNSFHIRVDNLERYVCDSPKEFLDVLEKHSDFQSFSWHYCMKKRIFNLGRYGIGIDFNLRSIEVSAHSSELSFIERAIKIVQDELKLRKPELIDDDGFRRKMLNPSIFVSRHFDDGANEYYYKVSNFFNQLGFSVTQGEEYTSQSIPEKVKHRMEAQDIIIVIVSGQRDHDWLIAEIGFAFGKDKHLIILKEENSVFNPTMLGKDLEFISFKPECIESVFTSILREFRSIGIKGLFY